jgi:hypothetical protein
VKRSPAFAVVAAAVVLGLLFWKRDAVVSYLSPTHDRMSTDRPATGNGLTQADRDAARRLRTDAAGDCDNAALDACENKLNHARKLDPAGEALPDVRALRLRLQALRNASPTPSG